MSYQLKPKGVRRIADNAYIPNDPGNVDWREYQRWVVQGNTPIPDDPAPAPPDFSDSNNAEKIFKAVLLAAASMAGRTPAQARAAFKAAWDSLP